MRVIGIGQVVFGIALIGLGILGLIYDDFAMNWQPVPPGIPVHAILAYASGALLLITGIGLFFPRAAQICALIEAVNLSLWIVLLRLDGVIAHPLSEARWLGIGENLVLVAGAWTLLLMFARMDEEPLFGFARNDAAWAIGRVLFAIALPLIGLSHIVFLKETAALIPAWIPAHTFFAWFTGLADMAAGAAVLLMIVPRLAATLAGAMMSLFTVLIWIPTAALNPHSRLAWTALMASAIISGGAWIIADSLARLGWLQSPMWRRQAALQAA